MPEGLFGNVFLPSTASGLPADTRRGLMQDAWRQFGMAGLANVLNPNPAQGLAAALAAGQQAGQAGAYDAIALQRQQEQGAQQAEQHEARMRQLREDARRRLAAEGEREENIRIGRQRLGEAGVDASGLDDDGVLDAVADLIAQQVDARATAMFPTPLTLEQRQYGELTRGQQGLSARELDLREAGKYAQRPARAQPTGSGIDKSTQAEIESVLTTLDALGAAQRFPGLLEEVRAELAAIKDPVQRKMRADQILAAASRAQRQSMGLE